MKSLPVSFGVAALAVLSLAAAPSFKPTYSVTNLGTLAAPFNDSSISGRINNYGQVTFQSFGSGNYDFGHACLWTPSTPNGTTTSTLTNLDPSLNLRTVQSGGSGINAWGQVVGFTTPPPEVSRYVTGFVWTPALQSHGTSGAMSWLVTSAQANDETHLWSLNNKTGDHDVQAVGNGPLRVGSRLLRRPLLWDGAGVKDLGALPGDNSGDANDINDAGEVVGYTFLQGAGNPVIRNASDSAAKPAIRHAFLWKEGAIMSLGALPGDTDSVGVAINAGGQVVGNSFAESGVSRSFLWKPLEPHGTGGDMMDLGLLSKFTSSTAFAVNSAGQVVGRAFMSGDVYPKGRAFLWDETNKIQDLNSLIDPASGWVLQSATGINDQGQIIGTGLYTDSKKKTTVRRAFLLTLTSQVSGAGK